MKKYLLGLFAVVLAIGFSAFTAPKAVKSNLTDPFWYKVDASTFQVLEVVGQTTLALAKSTTGCDDSSPTLCTYGYDVDPGYSVNDVAATGNYSFNTTQ